jgi:hypothetical protein
LSTNKGGIPHRTVCSDFCPPVEFDGLLDDSGVELGACVLETFGLSTSGYGAEDACGSLSRRLLPFGNLGGVVVELI